MKKLYLLFFSILIPFIGFSQVGINTTEPHQSSILDITANNKGVLIPRVALTSTNDIATIENPAVGLMVYKPESTSGMPEGFYFWDGTQWVGMTGSEFFWGRQGNTAATGDFIGTLNAEPIILKINNTTVGRIKVNGGLELGSEAASSESGIALGNGAQGTGTFGIGIGRYAVAPGNFGTAVGVEAAADSLNATAFGHRAKANDINSLAFGGDAQAQTESAVAVGPFAVASGDYGIAVGAQAAADSKNTTAFGHLAKAMASEATAFGAGSEATGGKSATAIGAYAFADGEKAFALGPNTKATAENAFALGIGTVADKKNTIILGEDREPSSDTIPTPAAIYVGIGTKDPMARLHVNGQSILGERGSRIRNVIGIEDTISTEVPENGKITVDVTLPEEHRPITVDGTVNVTLQSNASTEDIFISARLVDPSTVRVIFRNLSPSSITLIDQKLYISIVEFGSDLNTP